MTCAPAIGIDLGTTNSSVGVFWHGTIEIMANDQGNRTTPSYVAFAEDERFVGEAAKLQDTLNPSNTVFDAKRLIGRRFQDESVQSDMKHWPFEVFEEEGKPRIRVEHKGQSKTFHPEEISAMVLAEMKQVAEDYLGQTVTKAVVTVPAYFNDSQRQATKDAATIAGLDVLRIINEPTAAAIAYGLVRKNAGTWLEKRSLLVFDLGGGTFDVSVLTIIDGVFKVMATAGDTHLGGEDFNNRMVDHFVQEFKRKHEKDLTTSKPALCRLRGACEIAKRALSKKTQANIDIPCLFEDLDFHSTITRSRFDDLNADLFRNTLDPIENALNDAQMKKEEVDDIVMVGGSSRIPKIQKLLSDFFHGKEPCKDINPDEAVAYGAAVQAALLNGDKMVNKMAKGRKSEMDDIIQVGGSTRIPKIQKLLRDFFHGKEPSKDFNPDESVAYGDAVQAAILNGDQFDHVRGFRLQDVVPLSLGIQVRGKLMSVVIKRNTAIPTRCTNTYFTVKDNQTKGDINVYEGERPLIKDNNLLGHFRLEGIQNGSVGVANIEITFNIDYDGILHVSAVDKSTGANNQLTITNDKGRLPLNEIRRMVKDAKQFKKDDETQRSRIAAMNSLEDCAFSIRSTVEDYKVKGKISEDHSKTVLVKVDDTLEWLDRNQPAKKEKFEAKQKELKSICDRIIAKCASSSGTYPLREE